MRRLRGIFPAIFLLLACASAQAQLSLSVDVGWDGHYRIGRWAPLFLTLSDTTARPVIVEVRSPHSRGFGMHTRVALSVSPTPATYPFYLPLLQSLDGLLVTVRDARTERRLAQWPELDERSAMVPTRGGSIDLLIGTSGRAPTLRPIEGQTRSGQVQTVFVPPLKLPVHPAGYDAFNLLVLNQPDLHQLNPEQQQGIADWVRSGGSLLMWPGPDPLPPASPLVAALPCTIGENVTLQIDTALLENFGLAPRFANLRGRELFPKPGAERVATFGAGGPDAWRWRYGFGQVLVLPMDPSFFVFRDDKTARAFWHPLLAGAIDVRAPDETHTARYYWNDPALQRRTAAFDRAADLLGDVPGVGQFGFTYVAGVLIALMFIVGPIDWFVLKYLGKQPWTWATTSGWIALVTVGALSIGNLFKSGDLHFRTLRIIDQVDNQTVAATDLVCIYAPRTRFYEITVEREGWWQPGGDTRFGRAGAMTTDVPFGQDALSNRPAPMLINVWNLRFLQGETITNAPPMIDAQLALERDEANDWHLLGTITNRSRHVLRDIKVRSERPGGSTPDASNFRYSTTENLKQLQPGATARVRLRVAARQVAPNDDAAAEVWFYAGDLETDRSSAIDQLLTERDDLVCIYAEVEAPQPAVSIKSDEAIQQHWQILRALVPIATGEKS